MDKGTDELKQKVRRRWISFAAVAVLLVVVFFFSLTEGSLKLGVGQILRGLFFSYDGDVARIYDLRFPRVFIDILAGAALATSGTLLQAVMKNPLTDPGIIGISAAANFVNSMVMALSPALLGFSPLFSIAGGLFAYFLIYTLAWDGGVRPTRLILVGVALNMTFIGIGEGIKSVMGRNLSATQAIIEGNVAQKTWSDVHILCLYVIVFLVAALFTIRSLNLLSLEDKTARALGVRVDRDRFIVALIAIILASVTTAVAGVIGFLGLIVPHIGRVLVGGDHKYLLPFNMLLGSLVLLLSDTVGRIAAYPYEIPAAVIMAVFGGPFFIALLKLGGENYGD